MKTLQFKLDYCLFAPDPHSNNTRTAKYLAPTLPAYAIEYAELIVTPELDGRHSTRLYIDHGFEIKDQIVLWHSYRPRLFGFHEPILLIHYHGIRDYKLLFPAVSDQDRVQRLANYYEEADKCFETGAWLSFMLMCGAIFEGLLFDRVGSEKLRLFSKLIPKARKANLITETEQVLINKVREYRNIVHLHVPSDYVSRADVMDTRKVLDTIVQRLSYKPGEAPVETVVGT